MKSTLFIHEERAGVEAPACFYNKDLPNLRQFASNSLLAKVVRITSLAQLPSLNALRVFEAVARRGSFRQAAEDLFVTQSAISQKMKQLEEQLGQKLFVRGSGNLTLTASGETLLPAVSQAFFLIGEALERIDTGNRTVRLHASTSFATRWLMPRFSQFEEAFPNVTVRIHVGDRPDLSVDMIDLEIAYSFDPLTRDNAIHLMDEWLMPVCTPAHPAMNSPSVEELMQHRLLFNAIDGKDWRLWARVHDAEKAFDQAAKHATKLSTDASAIELALSGYGVALVNLHYAEEHMAAKRLVPAITSHPVRLGAHYICSHAPEHTASRTVIKWLAEQATLSAKKQTYRKHSRG